MDAYVYGVLRAGALPRPPAEGVDGKRVELVTRDSLAALVSDAPAVPVKANRRNLFAHTNVLQQIIEQRCVLPMRFGVVMPDRAAVADELLGAHRGALDERLATFDPYVELDLRLLCPADELLRAVVAERAEIRRRRAALAGRDERETHYERIELGELVAQATAAKREAAVERLVAALEPYAAATEVTDALHEEMLASAAFLVARDRVPDFDAAVERLGERLGPPIRIRYIGPLAPHNFVDLGSELNGAATWV